MRPYRDELAAALERTDRLARENAMLRAGFGTMRLDWWQRGLIGLIAACALTIAYLIASVR